MNPDYKKAYYDEGRLPLILTNGNTYYTRSMMLNVVKGVTYMLINAHEWRNNDLMLPL